MDWFLSFFGNISTQEWGEILAHIIKAGLTPIEFIEHMMIGF